MLDGTAENPNSLPCIRHQEDGRGEQKFYKGQGPGLVTFPSFFLASKASPLDDDFASLDLFARKSPRSWRDLAEKRALSARRLFFVDGGSIN